VGSPERDERLLFKRGQLSRFYNEPIPFRQEL
jgi:hypothetical protein